MTEPHTLPLNPKLQVSHLSLSFADAQCRLFEDLSFSLKPGQILVISGKNSSGKSTLINCLCGIIPKNIPALLEGSILWDDLPIESIPLCEIFRFMSVALAEPRDQLMLPTVELELAFALENMGLPPEESAARIARSADFFGLQKLLQADPLKLSGGEQRLLLLAICDSMQNPVILLDEPETGLSEAALNKLERWLKQMRDRGKSIVIASHLRRIMDLADILVDLDKPDV